jgi:chemotaxis signal transduction protein
LPVIDFGQLVLARPAKTGAKSRLIVTKPPLHCGFIVDEVCGVKQIVDTNPAVDTRPDKRFLTATFQQHDLTYYVFSLKHAANDAELRNFTMNQ